MGAIKKSEVKIGGIYLIRLNQRFVKCRIDSENPRGGWLATNLTTSREIRIRSAAKLRREVEPEKRLSYSQDEPIPNVAHLPTLAAMALSCGMCGKKAVVPLTVTQLAQQPDKTTHVCHPVLGGCNHGFEREGFGRKARR